jgi:lipopolysaccharide/colanic/teichoic acid biosynthesis glycosyltransferase
MGLWSLDRDAASDNQPGRNERVIARGSAYLSERAIVRESAAPIEASAVSPLEGGHQIPTESAPPATAANALSDRSINMIPADQTTLSLVANEPEATHKTPGLAPVPSVLSRRRAGAYERLVKPVTDKILAVILLVVLSPILAVVALLVRVSLGRPIVLRQRRVGRNGELFVLHKFRTMHPDRRRDAADFSGDDRRHTHKHPGDPRLTAIGRTLRKWSLDELPELWDVLTGKLSIVGPRPELEHIVANYETWQHDRHLVKPGLTGLWQVEARGDGEMHEHTNLDIEYVNRIGLRTDMKIMLLTIPAVLARKGY